MMQVSLFPPYVYHIQSYALELLQSKSLGKVLLALKDQIMNTEHILG